MNVSPGPVSRLVPVAPVLTLSPSVVVALVAQQVEYAGYRPALTSESRDQAEHAAGLLLAALGYLPPTTDPRR